MTVKPEPTWVPKARLLRSEGWSYPAIAREVGAADYSVRWYLSAEETREARRLKKQAIDKKRDRSRSADARKTPSGLSVKSNLTKPFVSKHSRPINSSRIEAVNSLARELVSGALSLDAFRARLRQTYMEPA